jgi:hypothetical protein
MPFRRMRRVLHMSQRLAARRIRAVTHMEVDDEGVEADIDALAGALEG